MMELINVPTNDYIRGKRDAEAERKKGKWIVDKGLYKCSSCNGLWAEWWAVAKPIEHMQKAMPYCPMCGADMRGEQDE